MANTIDKDAFGPGSNLRDRLSFPTFGDCPHEDDLDHRYYSPPRRGSYLATFKRHWCFLGEIVSVAKQPKLTMNARDTAGRIVRIEMISEDGGLALAGACKVGRTVAVLHALQHQFDNGVWGFVPETNPEVMVRSYPHKRLQQEFLS